MKVWAVNDFIPEQRRVFAAVESRTEFGRITDLTPHYLKNYAVPTGNPREIETAMAAPGRIFAWGKEDRCSDAAAPEDVTDYYIKNRSGSSLGPGKDKFGRCVECKLRDWHSEGCSRHVGTAS